MHLLALAGGWPNRDWCAATVGRGDQDPVMSALTAPSQDDARALLATLVRLHRAGISEPLPLAPKTSFAYAAHRQRNSPPKAAEAKAGFEWRKDLGDGREIGDFNDAWQLRAWGKARLADLLVAPARAGEEFDDEPHRFGQLARQVFAPLLGHEVMHG